MSRSDRTRPRAYRRHQRRRMIARRWRVVERWGWYDRKSKDEFRKEYWEFVHRSAEDRKKCSCYLCGNPRRVSRYQTHQEDLAVLRQWEELVELGLAFMKPRWRFRPSFHLSRQIHFAGRSISEDE